MSKASPMPVTTRCQVAETAINGARVRVIDTPDIFDDELSSADKNKHVTNCRQLCQSGKCVYLLVIQIGRFTDGERDILKKLERAFGSRARQQSILLFTFGEELQRANMSMEDFFQSCPSDLKQIVEQCDYRCVLIENKALHKHQVAELMQKVEAMF